jgi:hypothetical protein
MENSVPSSVCSIKKAADISYPDDGGFSGRPLQHLHDAEDYSRSQDAAAQEQVDQRTAEGSSRGSGQNRSCRGKHG